MCNVKSPICSAPEINIIQYVNYISIKFVNKFLESIKMSQEKKSKVIKIGDRYTTKRKIIDFSTTILIVFSHKHRLD